ARKSQDLNVAGAEARCSGSYVLTRIAAWGHTSAHLLHWMQIAGSHTGISAAMFLFSHRLVATGHVPSTGKALTGRRSPLLATMTAVTPWTKSGACGETAAGRRRSVVTEVGAGTAESAAMARSTASKLRFRTSPPFLP